MGDNLAAAINAHPALKGLCTAANAAGTVTVTVTDKGIHGNLLKLSETGDCIVATSPTNGAIGTVQSPLRIYRKGL
jgi:phage tail sheath gpL-like